MKPNIYTVPPGEGLLSSLARALFNGDLPVAGGPKPDVLNLQDVTLLLPTRRAARALQDAFLAASGARALLMPRIRPISEGEEELTLLSGLAGLTTLGTGALDLPPAVSPLERTLTLMQLVQRWREVKAKTDSDEAGAASNTPAQAAALAAELASLMDLVETENVSLSNLKDLVPEAFAIHWQQTVKFLEIVTDAWPHHLSERGLTSQVGRRNALILAEAERITKLPPGAPVIIAGVTGSIPATVTLMRAVAALPNGAIVLPALDLTLDEASWHSISPYHPEHPQFGLKRLLDQLGLARSDVKTLHGAAPSKRLAARAALVSEAMRPSATTERWHHFANSADRRQMKEALTGVSLIEAPSAQDEAETIALILREAIEIPGRTAALVSPDRMLARRVAIRLQSWGIRVDDSAGRPFVKTVPGTFLNLTIDAVRNGFAPAELMALLKHPLCRLGFEPFDIRRFGRALELAAFRAPYLGRGIEGVRAALSNANRAHAEDERQHPAVRRLWQEDWDGARTLVDRLEAAFAPLVAVYAKPRDPSLKELAAAHIATAEALAAVPAVAGEGGDVPANPLWQGEAGEAANTFFTGLLDENLPALKINANDYGDLYRGLLARENVRERTPVHPRLSIWGPFEARLQQPDVLILGSLNEGTWPEAAEPGAWLNRPMRAALGLPSPEEDIGRSAHDFISFLGAERVYMTRAEKIKGVPTVPSRWLMRLKALLNGLDLAASLAPDQPWLGWARARDLIVETARIKIAAPAPTPALDLRPRRMSVTRVEEWIRNPYAIYARAILKLEPLPALGTAPDQSLRGGLVHEVLSRFAIAHPNALPADSYGVLQKIATEVLENYTGHPRVAAFWMPRLQRFLAWFAETEPERRNGVSKVIAETSGSLVLDAPGGPFTLTARADRIDDGAEGLIITDYKTGVIPNAKSVASNRSPQLPLEAAIALGASGFPGVAGRPVTGLRYIRASGGEPPGEDKTVATDDIAALAQNASDGVLGLVAAFDDVKTPYRAVRRPGFRYDYDDYAGLARVAEWSAHVDEET